MSPSPRPKAEPDRSFRNAVFSSYSEFRRIDEAHRPSDSECYIPSSVLLRLYADKKVNVTMKLGVRNEHGAKNDEQFCLYVDTGKSCKVASYKNCSIRYVFPFVRQQKYFIY
jgi:hypothetical protein